MKREIRAAADKELPQDHAPFDFSLLPDDKNEYISSAVFSRGSEASSPATKVARSTSLTSPASCSAGCQRSPSKPIRGRPGS